MSADYLAINTLLRGIGKSTFVACYKVVAQNYNGNREVIKKFIADYGLRTTGQPYSYNVIQSKTSKSCTIFKNGWQKEALKLCGVSDNSEEFSVAEKNTVADNAKKMSKPASRVKAADKNKKKPQKSRLDKSKYTSNKNVVSDMKRVYGKIGRAIEKILDKYGVQGENITDYKISTLKSENARLRKELEKVRAELDELKIVKRASVSGVQKEYFIKGNKCSAETFADSLRGRYCVVHVTLFYENGAKGYYNWNVSGFGTGSSLSGNLHSNPNILRDWQRRGVTGVKLELNN